MELKSEIGNLWIAVIVVWLCTLAWAYFIGSLRSKQKKIINALEKLFNSIDAVAKVVQEDNAKIKQILEKFEFKSKPRIDHM